MCFYSKVFYFILVHHNYIISLNLPLLSPVSYEEKKEEIWLSPMTKAHKPTDKSKKQRDNIKNANKTLITKQNRESTKGYSRWKVE